MGNVLVTVSDMPKGIDTDSNTVVDYYMPDVLTVSDYEPFGAPLDGRTGSEASSYRFAFNGKEKVDEVYGDGNAYDFDARMYNPRIGRWLAVDPQSAMYSAISPYAFSLNCPLQYNDPNGEWVDRKVTKYDENGKPVLGIRKFFNIGVKHIEISLTIHNIKIYNGSGMSASPEQMQVVAANYRQELEAEWNTKLQNLPKGRTIKATVNIPEPIEIIDNLDKVISSRPKSDNLIYITPNSYFKGGTVAETPLGANVMFVEAFTIGLLDGSTQDDIPGHEFGHNNGNKS